MPPKPKYDLARVYAYLLEHPGARASDLARLEGMEGCNHQSLMLALERNGYLMSEDADGLVYPFRWVAVERLDGVAW